jgi:type II secretory pathway pseudopilin PulG
MVAMKGNNKKTMVRQGMALGRPGNHKIGWPGMTLVELFITIFILTVGCLAALKTMTNSAVAQSLANQVTIASMLAESEIERLKSLTRAEQERELPRGLRFDEGLDMFGFPCPGGKCPGQRYDRRVMTTDTYMTALTTGIKVEISWDSFGEERSLVRSSTVTWLAF